ncbi:hypothetical protein V2G26_020883 [Clonostachys chloroleuca]
MDTDLIQMAVARAVQANDYLSADAHPQTEHTPPTSRHSSRLSRDFRLQLLRILPSFHFLVSLHWFIP